MAYTLSPATLPATTEDTDISQTVTVVADIMDPPITSVVVSRSEIEGTIVITTDTSSFTISGKYNDNWDKGITYEDGNKVVKTATRWKLVESGYNFVTEYIAASSPSTKTVTFTVIVNGTTTLTLVQTINNDYTPGQSYLKQFVAGGKY